MAQVWEIRNVDGDLLYSGGKGGTKRAFVESLVRAGYSLARADLRRMDLSGLNLKDGDFREAWLQGSDLSGVQGQSMRFDGAHFEPFIGPDGTRIVTRMHGARLSRSVFDGANLTDVDATGARFTRATFINSILDGTIFTDGFCGGAVFSHARGMKAVFSGTRLVNADWSFCDLVAPDFRGASLGHEAFAKVEPELRSKLEGHLSNRTRRARIVGGSYSRDTKMSETVPAMVRDRRMSNLVRRALWVTTTMAAVTVGHYGVEPVAEVGLHALASFGVIPKEFVEHGASTLGYVGVMLAVKFANDAGGEYLKEKVTEGLCNVATKFREVLADVSNSVRSRMDLVCALSSGWTSKVLQAALSARQPEARKKGMFSEFRVFGRGFGEVILCDRRHLAMAMATIAMHANRSHYLREDITVVRTDLAGCEDHPCAVRFRRDGTSVAVWAVNGSHATVMYDRSGAPNSAWDHSGKAVQLVDIAQLGLPPCASSRLETALAMEAAIKRTHGLDRFDYPRETHLVLDGRDGAILVRRRDDARLDNPGKGQPAIIRMDGTGMYARNGGDYVEWEGLDGAEPCAPPPQRRKPRPTRTETVVEVAITAPGLG